jgi:hypothetical protein
LRGLERKRKRQSEREREKEIKGKIEEGIEK